MARFITDGFEWSDRGSFLGWSTPVGTFTYSTAQTAGSGFGQRAARFNVSGAAANLLGITNKGNGTYYYRFYVYFTSFPSADNKKIFQTLQSAGTQGFSVRTTIVSAQTRLGIICNTGGSLAVVAQDLSLATWYRCEVRGISNGSGTGEAELRLYAGDSTTALGTAQDGAANRDTRVPYFVQFGAIDSLTGDFYIDDFAMNDTTGSAHTSWVGPGHIALYLPASDDAVAWTKAGGTPAASNFAGVDETPPEEVTDWNASATDTQEDRFGITTGSTVAPTLVPRLGHLYSRFGQEGSGTNPSAMANSYWDDAGTQTDGTTINVSDIAAGSWPTVGFDTAYPLYIDLSSKTFTQVASYDIGYTVKTGGTKGRRVTALYLYVENDPTQTAAVAGGGDPAMNSNKRYRGFHHG